MPTLFLSHSTQDKDFARALQQALGALDQDVWLDSRELRGGDPLESTIRQAIAEASTYAVLVSPAALQSQWVGKELRHARQVQKQRGNKAFPILPLGLDGAELGAFAAYFDEEPRTIPVSRAAGGVEQALDPILVALGQRLPADPDPPPNPGPSPWRS